MPDQTKDTTDTKAREHVPLILDPCEKAHDAEHDRYTDEDGACDDGVN
jgi:hypothetical protein